MTRKHGSHRKAKLLLFDIAIVSLILVFIYSQLSSSQPRFSSEILFDSDFNQGFPNFWEVSVWNQSRIEYSVAYVPSHVMLTLKSEELGKWSGLGAFQGAKPYGWQNSGKGFLPVRVDDKNLTLAWKGKINSFTPYHGPASQCNLGVDLWFEAETLEGRKIAEVYVYFYQAGGLTAPLKTQITIIQRSLTDPRPDQAWVYMMLHHEQLTKGEEGAFSLSLNELLDTLRSTSPDPSFQGAPLTLTGVDCIMEVIGGEASCTLDYCVVGEVA